MTHQGPLEDPSDQALAPAPCCGERFLHWANYLLKFISKVFHHNFKYFKGFNFLCILEIDILK